MTATIMSPELTSDLPDLTVISLDDLRSLQAPVLVSAIERVYADAEFNTGNELQDQKQ